MEQLSDQSPLGTILAWLPHPEASLSSENLPDGWLPCNGTTITKGPWTGGKTPDLNSIGAFLRGGTEENILEVEDDQLQDHQHEDSGHQHDCSASSSAGSHHHSAHSVENECISNVMCGVNCGACHVKISAEETSSATVSVSTTCSTSSHSSGIGGVDSAFSRGTETRPINMKVSYVMRCW